MANDSLYDKNEKDQTKKPKNSIDTIQHLIDPCKELLYIGAIMCELIDVLFNNREGLTQLDLKRGANFVHIEVRVIKTLLKLQKMWRNAENKLMAYQQ